MPRKLDDRGHVHAKIADDRVVVNHAYLPSRRRIRHYANRMPIDMNQLSLPQFCASGERIRGIDVSKWQGTIDWDAVAQTDTRFVFIRASDGTNYLDEQFYRK